MTSGPLVTIYEVRSKQASYAWLGVPLIHLEQRFGMLALARTSGIRFNREEISLAAHFAAQAANAIKNALLYRELKQQLSREGCAAG